MKIQETDVSQADGTILLNEMILDDRILEKGHIINKEDILFFKIMGIKKIITAQMSPLDTTAEIALTLLAAKISGNSISYTVSNKNICKFVTLDEGVFICSNDRIAKFNRISPNLILNVSTPYKKTKKNEVVAVLEIRQPVVEKDFVDDVLFRLSGNEPLLAVETEKKEIATIIYSKTYDDVHEKNHFKSVVKKLVRNLDGMNIDFINEFYAEHNIESMANAIQNASQQSNLVFIVPSQPTSSTLDVVPRALKSIVDDVVCHSIPQVEAADLIIAIKKNKRIISLPYNYDIANLSLINSFIKMAIIKDKISQADFSRPPSIFVDNIELTDVEKISVVIPESSEHGKHIAAVILAAGVSVRARRNKLMAELDGEPLFMKVVRAAVASKASPVFVVTGRSADEMEDYLEKVDVNVIHNFDYISGVKTSIQLGLKSVPSFCQGAILLPADMPNITIDYINKMINSFDTSPSVCVSSVDGVKKNPVIWSSDLFDKAELVPENSGMVPVLVEHYDYTKMITADATICFDVTFPNDIEEVKKGHS